MITAFDEIIETYRNFPEVRAIAIGGSTSANTMDNYSDIDLYVFVESDISITKREVLVKKYSSKYEIGGEYFGAGDEYFVDNLDQQIDCMFWNVQWFENIINNVWIKHYPSNGYSTAFLFTLENCKIIYDKDNWLNNLKQRINTPYPAELKRNIIKRNLMLLKDKPFASYYEQIEKAIKRNDIVSINHRISAFLASYFDIIFAVNEILHPGEKQLISYAKNNCKILPDKFEENITALLIQPNPDTLVILDNMVKSVRNICDY